MTTDPLTIAVRALRRFGAHDANCRAMSLNGGRNCDCGLNEAREALSPPAAVGDSTERAVNAAESNRLLALAVTATPDEERTAADAAFELLARRHFREPGEDETHAEDERDCFMLGYIAGLNTERDRYDDMAAHIRKLEKEIEGRG